MFKIEKDVPLPMDLGYGGRPQKYPFLLMQVGDSFLIPADADGFYAGQKGARRHKAQNAAGHHYKKGLRFASRMLPDGSCRIWRTA